MEVVHPRRQWFGVIEGFYGDPWRHDERCACIDDVVAKLGPVVGAGCRTVTLCFDDLPVLDSGPLHAELAEGAAAAMDLDVFVVPTHYRGRPRRRISTR